jgi:CheY-like chemotaxis protein
MASVLLAAGEESTSSRVAARLALQAAGHIVREVHDGPSALAQIEAQRPDLLVLDTDLPGYDGFQVLDRLQRHHALRHLPVVVLSTIPRSIGGELARSLGAAEYLARPYTNVDLDAAVTAALGSSADSAPSAAPPGTWPFNSPWRPPGAQDGLPASDGQATSPPPPAAGDGLVELPPAPRRASAPRRPLRRA